MLTYIIPDDRFYCNIHDTYDDISGELVFDKEFLVPDVSARFLLGEEEYNKLKMMHMEEEENNVPTSMVN